MTLFDIGDEFAATRHIRVARTSEQRLRLERAVAAVRAALPPEAPVAPAVYFHATYRDDNPRPGGD